MKSFIILAGAAYLCLAQTVSAQHVVGPGVDLTWNACVNESGRTDLNLNCVVAQTYKLHACFKTPIDITGMIAADCRLDLVSHTIGPLAPFWQYGSGGCNESGLTLSNDITQSGGCDSESNPWGANGADAVAFITAYVPGFNGQSNRARIFLSIARSAVNSTTVFALSNYYLFHFGFNTAGNGSCAGCNQQIEIAFEDVTFYNNEQRDPEILRGPDKVSNCARIHNAANAFCGQDAVRNTTWGQLKSMYR